MKDWKRFVEEADKKFGRGNFGVVYRVYCEETGISYVGQTRDLYSVKTTRGKGKPTRILSHYNALKKGCHPHRELQKCFDSDPKTFTDEPIEAVQIDSKRWNGNDKLTEREKYWQEFYSATKAKTKAESWHFPLKEETLKALQISGVINNQALVYFILKLQNPWCDKPLKIEPLEIAIKWGIPESSVYEAILKLKNQGLLKITKATMEAEWSDSQQAPSSDNPELFWNIRNHSDNSESILKSQNSLREFRMNSESSENESSKALPDKDFSSSQTYSDYSDSFRLSQNAKEKDFSKENNGGKSTEIDQPQEDSAITVKSSVVDKFSGHSPAREKHELLTYAGDDTPWLNPPRRRNDINFKQEFMQWHGVRWMLKFPNKRDIHEAIADFRSCLLNNPDKIPGRWEEYQNHIIHHAENIKTRLEAGIEISSEEQQKMLTHLPVVSAAVAATIPTINGAAENPAAYLPFVPPQFTLAQLQKMHGSKWREAAEHFGYSQEEIEEFDFQSF